MDVGRGFIAIAAVVFLPLATYSINYVDQALCTLGANPDRHARGRGTWYHGTTRNPKFRLSEATLGLVKVVWGSE